MSYRWPTHGDIDGCFGYLSRKLITKNNNVLADLMKASMVLPRVIVYSLIDSRDSIF
jgi:hypothetical protein